MVFYMTDNLASYYVINQVTSRSPRLHSLVMEIKFLCQELGCQLEVHIPGTLMIDQGSNGLSHGIWLASKQRVDGINQRLFDTVPYTPALAKWACQEVGLPLSIPTSNPTMSQKPCGPSLIKSQSGHLRLNAAAKLSLSTCKTGCKLWKIPMGSSSFPVSFSGNGDGKQATWTRKAATYPRGFRRNATLHLTCPLFCSTSHHTNSRCNARDLGPDTSHGKGPKTHC
jgi:hypothetical protein